jgi:hypothetical protein
MGFSLSKAEELHIVKGKAADIIPLDGVNVYADLEETYLVGTVSGKALHILTKRSGIEVVKTIGERVKGSEYFFAQISEKEIRKLATGIEKVYFNGKEVIVRLDKGTKLDPGSILVMNGLIHISFIPMPQKKHSTGTPEYNFLTDPDIQAIVDDVSQAEYTAYLQRLEDFETRLSETDSCRAAERWARDIMTALGLETELFPYIYYYTGDTWYNAIGRKIGTVYPDSIYMIIGHIDATSEFPYNEAPGAEDNGSGTACVLEAARVLSQYDFDCTIEFVCVSGEEYGLIGSEAYASYCYSEDRNIAGVLNFDMIAYAGSYGWDTNIYADYNFPAELALADLLAQLTDDYTSAYSIRINTDGPASGSDHYYFSYYGFPAPFSIDAQFWGAPDWYPWYHSIEDRIVHLDLDFATEVVKGAVATLATVANQSIPPVLVFDYPNGLPDLINPDGGTTFRVEVSAGTGTPEPGTGLLYYNDGSGYTNIPMDIVSSNIYDAVFPAIDCGVEVSFFVTAETNLGETVSDPRNAPSSHYSAFCAYQISVAYEDDFSTNKGWTGLGGSGEWTIGPAVGGNGDDEYGGPDPSQDHSPSSDDRVLGNDLTSGDGDYEANLNSTYWVTSPVIDCSDFVGVSLSFYRWLGVEGDDYDNAYFQVYNGSSWVQIFDNGPGTIDDGSWREVSYDVSAYADGNSGFQVRFGIGRSDGGWEYCGWNIDDLEISGYSCLPLPELSATLIPDEDPTIVPQGGTFGMTASVTNLESGPVSADIWLGAYRGEKWFQQYLFRDIPFQGYETKQGHLNQAVPAKAPPGVYIYVEFCGDYDTWTVVDSSYFEVTVTE